MEKSRLLGVVCTCFTIASFNANAATFDNFTVIPGNEIIQGNGVSNTIINNLTVNGRWFLGATSSSTDLVFLGTQTVGGTGEIVMSDSPSNRWLGDAANTITVGSGLTVRGAGRIGLNLPAIINNGTFLAQGSNARLLIEVNNFINNGVLRAEGTQGLHLSGVNLTNNTSIDVNSGSALELSRLTKVNGVINIATGGNAKASQTTFDAVTINGNMQQERSQSNTFINGLTLNGRWNLNATSTSTTMNFKGSQSIAGNGEIVMSDSTSNRISGDGGALTVNSGIVIRGAGDIGRNISSINNQGVILAQGSNSDLLIRSSTFINNGVLRAEGLKGLELRSVNLINNTSVDVDAGSALLLKSSSVNGLFNITAGASATANASAFDAVSINGDFTGININNFTNGLTLLGNWNVSSGSDMRFIGSQSIGGVGQIVLGDAASARILGDGGSALDIGKDIVVRGGGIVGLNISSINNQGTVLAQGFNTELLIRSSTFINNGVLRAEGLKGLELRSVNLINNTSVDVSMGSSLLLKTSTVDGVFNIADSTFATANATAFNAVTINGDITGLNINRFTNGLTLNGKWDISAGSRMRFQGTQSIGGVGGQVVMADAASTRISGDGGALTVGTATHIRGAGEIGRNISTLTNLGTISALGIDNELRIRSNTFTNAGLLLAGTPQGMSITSNNFSTSGIVEVVIASQLNRAGDYVQTDGQTKVDGTLRVTGLIDIQGGKFTGKGKIIGDVKNAGIVAPGNSPGLLNIEGNYDQSFAGIFNVELAGLTAGTEYDVLDITGIASLAGTLDVDLFDSGSGLFTPVVGDSFDILQAETLIGGFDTLLLATLDGGLGWDISYLTDEIGSIDVVRLSVVNAVPIPAAVWLFGSGLLGLVAVARRKKVV